MLRLTRNWHLCTKATRSHTGQYHACKCKCHSKTYIPVLLNLDTSTQKSAICHNHLWPLLTVPLMRACWMTSKSSTGHQHSAMRHLAVTSRLNLFIVWKMDLIFTTFCFQVSIWPAISSSWVILWSCVWRNTWKHSTYWTEHTQNEFLSTQCTQH